MTPRRGRRNTTGATALSVAIVVTVVLLVSLMIRARSTGHDSVSGLGTTTTTPVPTVSITPTPTLTSSTPSTHPTTTPATDDSLEGLISQAPAGGVSVSAVNLATGKHLSMGATRGMLEASVSKIALLEILLLERQDAGKLLSSYEDGQLTEMIEHSSNSAADEVFELAGGHAKVVAEQRPLGLDTSITIYGPGNLWGLTTTSAAQQIILLRNLVDDDSPLNDASRDYALNLLKHVESDQRWGAPVAADKNSTYYVKNGWLAVDDDHDLWAVNTDGIITVHGHQVLVSVMTQHGKSYSGGVAYVEKLVKAVVAAVT